jgi:16S rRNA (guanine966-N2)-methyltransferase
VTGNRVRIIGGTWRSRLVRFADRPGLRPTPDRVRETLFNWLGQDLTGRAVLDLYAGSGALGFEAASRGARSVVMVERDATSARALKDACAALEAHQVEVVRADALEFALRARTQYDVIFLDPPFADAPWDVLLQRLLAHLAPEGLVYCESGAPVQPPAGWTVHREGRAGQVNYALLKRTAHEPYRGVSGDV